MGLTEVPSELLRMINVRQLRLHVNYLCSLPSEIALMTMLETLGVRLPKRLDRDLTKIHGVSGLQQRAHVSSARARSADQSQVALRAALEAVDHYLTLATCVKVGDNQLTSLRAEIGKLRQLEHLSVRDSNRVDRKSDQARAPGPQQ
jgi:Leucine-rich repeat (LRR) protein